jgi:hypothetical protein
VKLDVSETEIFGPKADIGFPKNPIRQAVASPFCIGLFMKLLVWRDLKVYF